MSSALTILLFGTATPMLQVRSIVTAVSSYPLLAIPLFILAGDLMYTGGLSKRLVRMADVWLGSVKASLAYATVAASTFFAAISGSGPATVAAIGSNVVPEMEKRGYPKDYSTGDSAKYPFCYVWNFFRSFCQYLIYGRNYSGTFIFYCFLYSG